MGSLASEAKQTKLRWSIREYQLVKEAELRRQSYGVATAQGGYGGPRGVWLECTGCNESQVIKGSNSDEWARIPNAQCAKVFRRHGWTGEGDDMKKAKCPKCSTGVGKGETNGKDHG